MSHRALFRWLAAATGAVWGLGTAASGHAAQVLVLGKDGHVRSQSWSLYQPGVEDSISYHQLVTGFLRQLCSIVHAPVYCTTAAHFERYPKHPPRGVS